MSLVSRQIDDDVVIVTIDNPPVSTGNVRLRAGLFDAFMALRGNDDVRAIVLHSVQKHFYSGSDIREFDGEIPPPSLPDVIGLMESMSVPIVAALNGLTLGGGCEFALASDVRIAATDAKIGLPEVKLGLIPGAGGTVRLPRLIGLLPAIDMIASGTPVSADRALELGLVDEVVASDALLTTAVERARHARTRRVLDLAVSAVEPEALEQAVAKAGRNGRARPNVVQAVDLVVRGAQLDGHVALAGERRAFDALRVGSESRNLRYLFFAKRAAAKDLATNAIPAEIRRVGIAGAGTMGSSIAAVVLDAGIDVVLYDVAGDVRARAGAKLDGGDARSRRRGALRITAAVEDLAEVDLVIDAVFEDVEVKTSLFAELNRHCTSDAIIASNTSYLDLNALAPAVEHPERLVGMHFFNPADRNPLLEIVQTTTTDERTLATMATMAKRLRKTPILASVGDGFVANRVYADYRMQAEYLVEDGASPRDIDAAMQSFGFPIGPFAVADMSGLDIAWARRKRLLATRNPNQRYVTIADTLCERGRIGKKVGAGWYDYSEAAPRGACSSVVDTIIADARAEAGIEPRRIEADEVQRRIVCSMLVAAAELVERGIARRASDIDVALTEGFAFPTWLGGPVRFAASKPEDWVLAGLGEVYRSDPIAFAAAADADEGRLPRGVAALFDSVRS